MCLDVSLVACDTPNDTANWSGTFYTFNYSNIQLVDTRYTINANEDSNIAVKILNNTGTPSFTLRNSYLMFKGDSYIDFNFEE